LRACGNKRNILRPALLLTLMLCLLAGCGGQAGRAPERKAGAASAAELSEFSDLSGKTVSMLTGAPFEELVLRHTPDVSEFSYFSNMPDMLLALKSEKTDAVLINNAVAVLAVNRDSALALFPHNLEDGVFGFAFAKGSAERQAWQTAYDAIPDEAKRAAWEKWTGADESAKVLPEQDWPGLNGTVTVAACDTLEPMSYAGEGGRIQGFDVEMALLTAKELDVHVEFVGMEFSAVMSYVQSGKALFGVGSIIVTEERRQAMDFMEYYPAAFVLIVRAAPTEAGLTLSDLSHARIGTFTGANDHVFVRERLPEAELAFFNTPADAISALESGKIDAFTMDEPAARSLCAERQDIVALPEKLGELDYAYILPKTEAGEALCAELSEYLRELKADGTLAQLQEKWFDSPDPASQPSADYRALPAARGTLRAATTQYVPFAILKEGMYSGYEAEILAMFCARYGYALTIEDMNVDGILASVQIGKCDVGFTSLSITAERQETLLFSEPSYTGGPMLLVMKNGGEQSGGVVGSVVESFEKTFIRENRWKLFVQGIGTTMLITVLAILFGTALGFGTFLLCRRGNPAANAATRFLVWLVQGMPVVVLLMILYYVIFGRVSISGTAVSVVGFALVFGAAVYAMVKSGVATVDVGQTEAAYALGYTDAKTFFRVVLPQALPHIMPAYKGEITALIKATAIVGYVAVQDLTKMGDIVRSRTYDAFFPLIAVAVIYFILAAILTFVVNRIELRIDPKRRTREQILDGVKTDR